MGRCFALGLFFAKSPHCDTEQPIKKDGRNAKFEHTMLDGFGQRRDRFLRKRQKSQFSCGTARQIQPTRAPHLVLPINAVVIFAGVRRDLIMCQRQQLVTRRERQTIRRAYFGTGRNLSFLSHPLKTKGAFPYRWRKCIRVLIRGYLKWTGDHAIPAAKTFPRIVCDRTGFLSAQRPYYARGRTSRFDAMHALRLDKSRFLSIDPRITVYNGIRVRRWAAKCVEYRRIFVMFQREIRQAIGLGAGKLALAATNALRRIYEHPHLLVTVGRVPVFRGAAARYPRNGRCPSGQSR